MNDGTIYGSSWVAGKYGYGLDFNGSSDYVEVPNSSSLNMVDVFSASAWVKGDVWNTPIAAKIILWKNAQYVCGVSNNGKGYFYLWIGSNWVGGEFGPVLSTGDFHHLAYTYDGARMVVYADGAPYSISQTGNINTTTNPLLIGSSPAGEYFNGVIDDVRIYDRVLSQSEINASLDNVAPRLGLVGEWRFDEGTGTIAQDSASWTNTDNAIINKQLLLQSQAPSVGSFETMAQMQVGNGGGNGYTTAPSVTIRGGGASIDATAEATINETYGTVTSITVTNGGDGYTSFPGVYISSPAAGTTASAMAITDLQTGVVKQIILTGGKAGGYGYTSTPTVTISGAGSDASANAEYDATYTRINRINVVVEGTGYTSETTTVTISNPNEPTDAKLATASAIVEGGHIKQIFLTGELPRGQSFERFKDTASGANNRYSELFLFTNPAYGDYVPIIGTNETFIVKKDFQAGGLLGSQQGAILLNHGFKGKPILSSPPCIDMMSSGVPYPYVPNDDSLPTNPERGQLYNSGGIMKIYNGNSWDTEKFSGFYDTLFLFKFDGITPAHMRLGNLYANCIKKVDGEPFPFQVSPEGLVLHLPFDEGAGSTAYDESAYANNATITDTTNNATLVGGSWTNGVRGNAITFNGTSQYGYVDSNTTLNPTNISISARVKSANLNGTERIACKRAASGGYSLYISSDNKVYFAINYENVRQVASTNTITRDGNTWVHIVATFDGSYLRIYINGELGCTPLAASTTIGTNNNDLGIGVQSPDFGLNYYLNGSLDELQVFNRALSQSEVTSLFNSGASAVAGGLVAQWVFDESSGSTAYDTKRWVNGKYGKALNFYGTNYASTGKNRAQLGITNEYTVVSWFKPTLIDATWHTVVGDWDGAGTGRSISLGLWTTNKIYNSVHLNNTQYICSTDIIPTVGQWYFVASTLKIGDSLKVYVNGKLEKTTSLTGTTDFTDSPIRGLAIGVRGDTSTPFNGVVDEIRVYNRVLSESEIAALMSESSIRNSKSVVATNKHTILNSAATQNFQIGLDGTDTQLTTNTGKITINPAGDSVVAKKDLHIDKAAPTLNLNVDGIIKGALGFDGSKVHLMSNAGNIEITPYTNITKINGQLQVNIISPASGTTTTFSGSLAPPEDNQLSLGISTKAVQSVYTRSIDFRNNSVNPAQYVTLSVDNTGLILNIDTSSTTGKILPPANSTGKTIDLGSTDHRMNNIFCANLSGGTGSIVLSSDVVPDGNNNRKIGDRGASKNLSEINVSQVYTNGLTAIGANIVAYSSIFPSAETIAIGGGSPNRFLGVTAITGYFDNIKKTDNSTFVFSLANLPSGTGFLKASGGSPTYVSLAEADIPHTFNNAVTFGGLVTINNNALNMSANKWIQWNGDDTRLFHTATGVLAVQAYNGGTQTWQAGTLDTSNIFFDHLTALTGGVPYEGNNRITCNSQLFFNNDIDGATGIRVGTYLHIAAPQAGTHPVIGINAMMTNGNPTRYKPAYSGSSGARMGLLQFGCATEDILYRWYNSGLDNTEVNEGSFTTVLQLNKDGLVSYNHLKVGNNDYNVWIEPTEQKIHFGNRSNSWDTKLARVDAGVIAVQDANGEAGTLDASNIFADHLNSLTGASQGNSGTIYCYNKFLPADSMNGQLEFGDGTHRWNAFVSNHIFSQDLFPVDTNYWRYDSSIGQNVYEGGYIGSNVKYWHAGYFRYLYGYETYIHDYYGYDTLPDLELIKKYRLDEKNRIAKDSLPFLQASNPDLKGEVPWDAAKTMGFLIGCIKSLAEKVEKLEAINK